jgi:hypothetical protein
MSAAPAAAVEQWDVLEISLQGPTAGNPFTEVELTARFMQGDRAVQVTGFYDGNGVYKVRFMPDAVGEWRYETASNRPELNGRGDSFPVTPPSPGNHGPVRVAHTFHFSYADGTPYRQIGTTSYSWIHQTVEREEQTLRTLAGSPFNKIRMCVFPQNHAAHSIRFFPFEGTPPRDWDTAHFNPEFFRHLEQRVGQLRDLGIEADLILFHPYGNTWPFSGMDAASDDHYLRYLVARLAAYRNVWWSLCNEWDFLKTKQESDWDRIFQVIQTADPYAHLRSIHNAFVLYNNSQPWVTHASIQQGAAVLDPERAMIYRDAWRKPVVYDEVKYEGNSSRRWGQLKAEQLVLRFWNGTVAGTYVGHGEILGVRDAASASGYSPTDSRVGYWLGSGGELRGESAPRLAFLKRILDDSPPEGIEPIDKWQDRRMGGKTGEYYLLYLGEKAPTEWPFVLFRAGLADGMTFSAEVIDTWNMTIKRVDGVFETKRKDDYEYVDKTGRAVPLSGRPYQAIRLRRVWAAPAAAPGPAEVEP